MNPDLLMQLQFAAVARLQELRERIHCLGSFGFDGQQIKESHFYAVASYHVVADWLLTERFQTPTVLELEVFG